MATAKLATNAQMCKAKPQRGFVGHCLCVDNFVCIAIVFVVVAFMIVVVQRLLQYD